MNNITKTNNAEIEKAYRLINIQEVKNRIKGLNSEELKNEIDKVAFLTSLQFKNPYKSIYWETKLKWDHEFKNFKYRIPWEYLRNIEPEDRASVRFFLKFIYEFKSRYFKKVNSINKEIDKFIEQTQLRQINYTYDQLMDKKKQPADAYIQNWEIDFFSIQQVKVLFSNYYFYCSIEEILADKDFISYKEILQGIGNDVVSMFYNFFNNTNEDLNKTLHTSLSRTSKGSTQKMMLTNQMKNTSFNESKRIGDFFKKLEASFNLNELREEQVTEIINSVIKINPQKYFKQKVIPAIYNTIILKTDKKKDRQLITYDLISRFGNPINEFPTEADFKSTAYANFSKLKIENLKIQRIKRIMK